MAIVYYGMAMCHRSRHRNTAQIRSAGFMVQPQPQASQVVAHRSQGRGVEIEEEGSSDVVDAGYRVGVDLAGEDR